MTVHEYEFGHPPSHPNQNDVSTHSSQHSRWATYSYGSILRIGTCEIERVRKQSHTPKPVNWVDRKATPKVVFAPELASSNPRGHACASEGAATNVRDRLQFGQRHPAKPLGQRGLRRSSSTLEVNNDQRSCRLPNHPGGEKTAPNVVFRPGPVRQGSV